MNNIAMTLGRTQPPHLAHIHMLVNALFSLNENGQLIHFVSSSNMPVSVTPGSVNILTTEQRIELLTSGLQSAIQQRYQDDHASVPGKYAQRLQSHQPLLSAEDFRCIPLPDFSDNAAHFDTAELQLARSNALNIVRRPALQAHVKAQGNIHSDSYYAWAVHLKTLLDEAVEAYCQIHPHIDAPKVTYFTCTKDDETQRYVAVIMDMMNYLEPASYDFVVNFTPAELMDGTMMHSTAIRDALLNHDHDSVALKSVPEGLLKMLFGMIQSGH
jgi:hypothetical protein